MRESTHLLPMPGTILVSLGLGVVSLLVLAVAPAGAAACGDLVDGKRVACACGDHVVSDTVLWPTDPVVSEPCPGNGLTILAASESDGLTLNLGGQSIAGSGRGTGIRVAHGGRLGSVILGGDRDDPRGEVAGFATGIRVNGRLALRELKAIDLQGNARDGLRIHASGVRIEDVNTYANGRHGLALAGHGNQVASVVTDDNGRDGLQVRGSGATIRADSAGNGRHGVVLGGRGNRLVSVRSIHNGANALLATGGGHDVAALQRSDNGEDATTGRPGATK